MIETKEIFRSLIGQPYGKWDCWSLCVEVCRRVGIELPSYDISTSNEKRADLVHRELCNYTKIEEPEPFSLILFRFIQLDGIHYHVGVILPELGKFIHCTKGTGVAITALNHPLYWLMREGFYIPKKQERDVD